MTNTAVTLYGGETWDVFDIDIEAINIRTIAHSLSLMSRWGGHVNRHFSVAQHSVLVSKQVQPNNALWGLLHDADEALGLNDMISPVKRADGMEVYRELCETALKAVAVKYDLPWPVPEDVHDIDTRIRRNEREALGRHAYDSEGPGIAGLHITPWSMNMAENMFLSRFLELTGNKYQHEVFPNN